MYHETNFLLSVEHKTRYIQIWYDTDRYTIRYNMIHTDTYRYIQDIVVA